MKKYVLLSLCLSLFVQSSLASLGDKASKIGQMKNTVESSFERVVLEGSETVLDTVHLIKDERRFNRLVYELGDWYKVALIKRDMPVEEIKRKYEEYKSHLLHLANTDDPKIKDQLIEEYLDLEKMQNSSTRLPGNHKEAQQVLLAKIYSKHVNTLQSSFLSADDRVNQAALALRILTEAYVMAANPDLNAQQTKMRERALAIHSMAAWAAFFAMPVADMLGANDFILKSFWASVGLFTAAGVGEFFFYDTKTVQWIRNKVAGYKFAKEEANRLVDIFWMNVDSSAVKSVYPHSLLNDHLTHLQKVSSTNLEVLSHKYRVLGARKCSMILNFVL